MNAYGEAESPYCYFHPREFVVGVCAHCLKERLLVLASKQSELSSSKENRRSYRAPRRKNSISLPKVFAIGSFLQRLDSRHHRRHDDDDSNDEGSIASLEDSFISIKFEGSGNPSWDNKKVNSIYLPSKDDAATERANDVQKSVVEHTNRRGGVLKWRKQISRLLQLSRWKRSTKTTVCQAGLGGKVEGVKAKRGWIRSFTRRRNNTSTQEGGRAW